MTLRRRLALTAAAGCALALTLTGCGTTDVEPEATGSADAAVSEDCATDTTATSTDPVSLTDGVGRTVELDTPASRIVVLEWQEVEDALTLCVTPVGVADPTGFGTWISAETLPEGVVDVGTREEPDLDALYATDPDLIIVEAFAADDEVITQLEEYDVPVLAARGNNPEDPVGNVKDVFSLVAEATGRTERADQVLAEFDEHLAERAAEVTALDLPTREFLFFDGWVDGGNVTLRPYTEGALFTALGEELGLTPVWDESVNDSHGTGGLNADYGLAQTDIEGLTGVGDATLFYSNGEESGYVAELEKNSIWNSLPAVVDGRAYEFPVIWGAGGPRSTEQAIDAFADALTGK
ncbi:ABC transporter substrate-binding protein [Mycetocola reblochoni]|uniref:Ferric hydroxamate ABC transporter (TC 3.A.1.14.3), periplasmic substrate binding protein FhuD n=1 Tax=Mycetocola reblochoni REB411 TaxID=1255698 RepID=A0A1R4JI61_9MICO|nr:ABC transporter substrate-binding protein [Mycetocola reblochoni]SJN31624.1 Ferric hydroxamate ABC transporter (TC 3.A.1.14.3), periplasmic substrate binding protein FhuD [Mycetocola reblochoni REB411]